MSTILTQLLEIWIYPIAALAPILDGLSTYLALKYADGAEEMNPIVASIHDVFGLTRGQLVWSTFATIIFVAGVYAVSQISGLAITSLLVGIYLGFSIKQLQNSYEAYKYHGESHAP